MPEYVIFNYKTQLAYNRFSIPFVVVSFLKNVISCVVVIIILEIHYDVFYAYRSTKDIYSKTYKSSFGRLKVRKLFLVYFTEGVWQFWFTLSVQRVKPAILIWICFPNLIYTKFIFFFHYQIKLALMLNFCKNHLVTSVSLFLGLCNLVACSLVEDSYGVVQKVRISKK